MKIVDVSPFHDGLNRNIQKFSKLETEAQAIKSTLEVLIGMDEALKGQGGNAIRSFYNECHLPFLDFFKTFNTNFTTVLEQMHTALSSLESNPDGYISQSFLEVEIEEGLTKISQLTESLTNESNVIMGQVQDIVSLPHLNDSDVQIGVKEARTKRDNTVTDLNEFDSTQTNKLTAIENDLTFMTTWVTDLESLFKDGLTDIDFPAGAWMEYSKTSPLKTALENEGSEMPPVTDGTNEDTTGNVDSKPTITTMQKVEDGVELLGSTVLNGHSSFAMFMAYNKGGLTTVGGYRDMVNGNNSYRVYADAKGLKYLGVETSNGNNKGVLLKAASKKPGSSQWFNSQGQSVLKNHPQLEYWSNSASIKEKAQNFGKSALKGTKNSFTDIVDIKGIKNSGLLKGSVKALGPAGAALSYYNNFDEAKKAGLSDAQAAGRATVDTTVDTAVGGAVQAGSIALLTVLVPVPGLGTILGVGLGVGLNYLLNKEGEEKDGKPGKSTMDHIKGWFR